ncbi:hypothetical protein LCGC14_1135010 [marine sediment metagenome]|uniref:Uncharacterized protein n=1 Tax=marine sediment metagenome TaxID=412755 RepID=A0A0F9PI50_9ZZZZ
MTDLNPNPLQKYMRHPELYIKVPSNGYFNDEDTYPFSSNNEIGIAPMTTQDELLLKTPDALLNGESIAKLIESCVPGIKNVRNLPISDVSVILLGIRMSSYGHEMEYQTTCPECNNENYFSANLEHVLASMNLLEESYIVSLTDKLSVSVRPHTYESSIKQILFSFNETKLFEMFTEEELSEEELSEKYVESFKKMAALTVEIIANSVVAVLDENGIPIDATRDQIFDWVANISRKDAKLIQNKIEEINKIGIDEKAEVICGNEECKHKWTTQIGFDPANFFE